jgi:hypothetical protein
MAVAAYFVFLKSTPQYPIGQLNLLGWRSYGMTAAIVIFVAIMISTIGTHPQIPISNSRHRSFRSTRLGSPAR